MDDKNTNVDEKRMMKLPKFCSVYDIPKTNVIRWIYSKKFPAYKLGKNWFIDIKKFEQWREKEHKNNFKYA